ncbi:MAG: hypothetical protein PHX74_08275 [Candidatus Sumerlaeales bacterium]|nr:hypothetical protein [Candidatus Sumerlaeales bacterium]
MKKLRAQDSSQGSASGFRQIIRHIMSVLFVGLSLGFLLYYWHREGLLPLDAVFGASDHPMFRRVLGSLFLPWHIWWGGIPWGWLSAVAFVHVLYIALGWLILSSLRQRFLFHVQVILSLGVGMGVSGIVFELLCMAGYLGRIQIITAWVLMFLIAGVCWFARSDLVSERPIEHPSGGVSDTPAPRSERVLWWLSAVVIGLISALLLLHGVGYPETYWDSLILYMGYARKIFNAECFPFKAVGQVGIGLGANYPHLVAVLFAATGKMFGEWNDIVCQLSAPVLSFGSIVFIYATVYAMTRDRLVSISSSLLVRSVPYGLCYGQFASDYAFAIFYTAAFLYLACLYIQSARRSVLFCTMMMAAVAMHINYLMGVLWVTGFVLLFAAHWSYSYDHRVGVGRLFASGWFWVLFIFTVMLALPWYIRNWLLTGNPVYAFYSNLLGGVRINPTVMDSAVVEWKLNGDGLYGAGSTLIEKLQGSWGFFVTGPQHWKLQPVLFGFVLPGVLIWILLFLWSRTRGLLLTRFGVVSFSLFMILATYAYCMADYYLYQVIIILPLFGIFAAYWIGFSRKSFAVVALLVGFAPGLVMGMMGFKLKTTGVLGNEVYGQHVLTALRNPFMDKDLFMRMAYEGDMEMFAKLTQLSDGACVLTHENRHLLLDERLRIVHLDDWEIQSAYGKSADERLSVLDDAEVDYYLYVPNEDKHRANSWVGMDELIGRGDFEEMWRVKAQGGSTREGLEYKHIPADYNVLYRRVRAASGTLPEHDKPTSVTISVEDFAHR